MKRDAFNMDKLIYLLFSSLCLSLVAGCSTDYTEVDLQGNIVEVNAEESMILVEDQERGQIWVDVSDLKDEMERLHSPLEVNVWLDEPVTEDKPGKAEQIDVIK